MFIETANHCDAGDAPPLNADTTAQVYKDSYNFHQSSVRIAVECAFGMLVQRFGIFWRSIECSLENTYKIIKACTALHNVCIDRIETAPGGIPSGSNGWGSCRERTPRTWREKHIIRDDTGKPILSADGKEQYEMVDHSSGYPMVFLSDEPLKPGQGARVDASRTTLREAKKNFLQHHQIKRPGHSSWGRATARRMHRERNTGV